MAVLISPDGASPTAVEVPGLDQVFQEAASVLFRAQGPATEGARRFLSVVWRHLEAGVRTPEALTLAYADSILTVEGAGAWNIGVYNARTVMRRVLAEHAAALRRASEVEE